MNFLGIFDFYHIENYGNAVSDIWNIMLTALLSGLVAWSAAYLQIELSRFRNLKDQMEEDQKLIELFKYTLPEVIKSNLKFLEHLENTLQLINDRKNFGISDQTLDMVYVKMVQGIELERLSIAISNLKLDSNQKELLIRGYSATINLLGNYEEIRKFYYQKHLEYNTLTKSLNESTEIIAIRSQDLIFSKGFKKFISHINSITISERPLYRNQNLRFEIISQINSAYGEYQKKKDSSWKNIGAFVNNLKEVISANKYEFPDITLAQIVNRTLMLLSSMDYYYSTYSETLDAYIIVTKEIDKYLSETNNMKIEYPKKTSFFRYIFHI